MSGEVPTIPSVPQPQGNNNKKGSLKALVLLKVGLIEVMFVGIVLIAFFGVMNFFKILPISEIWPNQFGWLPHSTQSKSTPIPHPAQTPTNYSPTVSQYDTEKAKTILTQYIKDNIKPEFVPSAIDVKNKLIDTGKEEGTDYEFGANWTINNIFFQSNFHYQLNSNNPTDMEFSIKPQGIKETSANASLAKILTTTYLKNVSVSPTFECGTFKIITSFCENFSTTALGKTGFGLVIGRSTLNITMVFSCFIPKDSAYYQTRTSCLLFREKT